MEQSRHGEGVTSVKVHHQPGGHQQFNIFGGEEEPKKHTPAVVPHTAAPQQEEVKQPAPVQQQPVPQAAPQQQ